VGTSGEYSVDALTHSHELNGNEIPILSLVNEWFDKFDIPYLLDVSGVGDEVLGDIAKLMLRDNRTGVYVAATDVGFGIGQVLPILVEGILAATKRRMSILCVEQPELHLHPRLQANIGDFLIQTNKLGRCQWIIETHSEALMLRIQKRIREKAIAPSAVSVLYVNPVGKSGSEVRKLEIDEDGNFLDE